MSFEFDYRPRIGSSWNVSRLIVKGELTDRKIKQYQKRGWYSQEFKDARKEFLAKKANRRAKRDGSFLSEGGRLIYSPL